MISKKEFRELTIEEQVELVNNELKEAKGTKNFGKTNLDFSYGFARSILISNGYETLDEESIDGIKIKLFRKMTEDEIKERENKVAKKEEAKVISQSEITTDEIIVDKSALHTIVAEDMFNKNQGITDEKKTKSRSLPIFEDTYEEFMNILNSDEFKLYEKKYIIELMFRMFIDKYKKNEDLNEI